jgi:hypothetical protein
VKFIFLFLFFAAFVQNCVAQAGAESVSKAGDSLRKRVSDTARAANTSLKPAIIPPKQLPDTMSDYRRKLYLTVLSQNPYFNFFGKPRYELPIHREGRGKEGLFYLLTGLVFYFALIKLLFGKYFSNLVAVFFRVSLKQKQIREQLLQSTLPSLLLNIFFVLSGGIYVSFLLSYYNFAYSSDKWLLILYSVLGLGIIYLGKFLVLKVMGWIFNISEATDTYIFVVFLVNKLLGVFLLPFLILLAFSSMKINGILVALSFTLVAVFFAYRYIISYAPVRKEVKVSQFHFLLYICALEVIPLLLIYKVLLNYLERSS